MKVVTAIDSLKGCLTSMEAGNAIKKGILAAIPDAEVIIKPLADGGEGTTDALIEGLNGERITLSVSNPFGSPTEAYYGYLPNTQTAIIEMAQASGITLIPKEERNPLLATTYGVGEMIVDAIQRGCRDFIIGIGGSATNDGGVGMLQALGYEFWNPDGQSVGVGAQCLNQIASISDKNRRAELSECHFKIACDVTNPLCGMNGATYIYGPQKGVTEENRDSIDAAMLSYANITAAFTGMDHKETPGSGAAGGMGFAFISYLSSELVSGIDLILKAVDLEDSLIHADYVITGEGRLDHQTAMGKAPVGVARLAKQHGAKVIALAGSLTKDAKACHEAGIDSYFCILNSVIPLEEAMNKDVASANMTSVTEEIFRLLR